MFFFRFSVLRQPTGPDGTNGFSLKRIIDSTTTTTTTTSDKENSKCINDGVVSVGSEQEVHKMPTELPSAELIDEQVAALSVSWLDGGTRWWDGGMGNLLVRWLVTTELVVRFILFSHLSVSSFVDSCVYVRSPRKIFAFTSSLSLYPRVHLAFRSISYHFLNNDVVKFSRFFSSHFSRARGIVVVRTTLQLLQKYLRK